MMEHIPGVTIRGPWIDLGERVKRDADEARERSQSPGWYSRGLLHYPLQITAPFFVFFTAASIAVGFVLGLAAAAL